MKHHFYFPLFILLFSSLTLASFVQAQSVPQLESAAKALGAGLEPPISATARGLVSRSGDIALEATDGTLTAGLGKVSVQSVKVLAPGSTPQFAPDYATSVFRFTPAANGTIAGVKAQAVPGKSYYLVVTTSGTSSYTLTFGTNFKTANTLATGTVTGKVFVIQFIYDGVNFNEVSRTVAL